MKIPRFSRSASLLPNRCGKRNEADGAGTPASHYSERYGDSHEAGLAEDQNEPHNSEGVIGSFESSRSRCSSPQLSQDGSNHASTISASEYNSLESQEKSRRNFVPIRNFQQSFTCWIISGITMLLLLTTLLATLLAVAHANHARDIGHTVDLGYAQYVGVSAKDDAIVKWLGIRYAAPPLGDLRFRAPQDPIVSYEVQQADTYGATCLSSPSTGISPGYSEDCLFLNVYAPRDNSKTRPVFVFIQGGGFNVNSSPNLNGAQLIEAGDHDMIVITFNYRVGPWGFLASKEVQDNGDLNAGLLDQRFVLQWVQKYIHLFGGDPNRVTIGGASAGAASVDIHMTAYGGRNDGLFHAAAAESQSFGAQLTVPEAQYQYDALVQNTGCGGAPDTLACLRNIDINHFAAKNSAMASPGSAGGNPVFMYGSVIDGDFIQDNTYTLFATGRFIRVPTIIGDDTNEGTIFTPKNMNNYNDVGNFLKNNFPKLNAAQLAEISFLYPKAEQFPGAGAYWRTAANVYGEMRYNCPGIWVSTILDKSNTPSWLYRWDVVSNVNMASGLGATHTAEAGSIWGTSTNLPESALNPMIQSYWASFIRTHDPNALKLSSAPTWQGFNILTMQRLRFVNDPSKTCNERVPLDQLTRCAFLTTIGGGLGQ